jgi:hypothetical protein
MKLSIQAGATSQSVLIFIQDSSSTIGAGLAGLAYNTAGLTAYYSFAGANATATAITLATLATVTTAWSSGGFIEIDNTHMKGVYRLDIPNAAIASSKGRSVVIYLYGATNMAPLVLEIELTGWDNQDGIHGGMSGVPVTAWQVRGTVTTGGSTTSVPTSALTLGGSAASGVVANQFVSRVIVFDNNTTTAGLQGSVGMISASSASNTPTFTVSALPAAPASGDTFSII